MGKTQVILVVLLGMVKGLAALSCLQCGTFTCPPLPSCQGDVTKDACGCCDVCAKIPGESCGGQWNISGTCSSGLTCVVDPNEPLGNQATGTCACPPDSSWNSCGTACPKTCEGRPFACAAVCVPRCECYPWYVLDNGNCIPESLCSSNGCNYEGQHYNDGDEWAVRNSPGLVCRCDGTQVVCYVIDCAPGYSHVIGRNGLTVPNGIHRPR
ncbi:PREDICTED: cysteine-rich motor neuron 1 protein-like [Branchiostoma belcheri]|uniref:Cysteine-rich motor neuron 1 protein-like n=1 Tax=Branchiostoma belcheri TaxID=7741 RepID=A0A6P5AP21_BRABE|nr:PREDICTED: cysteine-rich motor neuron 1 protein-like [Branchiostoma belcheri]